MDIAYARIEIEFRMPADKNIDDHEYELEAQYLKAVEPLEIAIRQVKADLEGKGWKVERNEV